MYTQHQRKSVKRTFWAVAAFYMLIAFEFLYMASPFAVYFYSVYEPGLNFLNEYPNAAWLISFFLPHIVEETSSTLINVHNVVGIVLAVIGFVAFCAGAGHVYYFKLRRKGVVTGGIYNVIRHPQYVSLAICSFGLLLCWPRYIVLVMFITILFAYYFLAKAEERECEEKYGQAYRDYTTRTNMFLPFRLPFAGRFSALPKSRPAKFLYALVVYALTIAASIGLAKGLQSLALESLYIVYSEDSAYLSVNKVELDELESIIEIALTNQEVQTRLESIRSDVDTKFLNYVLPTEWCISEIPMNPIECRNSNHFLGLPADYDRNLIKIIFCKASVRSGLHGTGKEFLMNIFGRTPVFEVRLDLLQKKVINILEPPAVAIYENIPVPVY